MYKEGLKMKRQGKVISIILTVIVILTSLKLTAQESKQERKTREEAEISQMIKDKRFVFVAQQAFPMAGSAADLSKIPGLMRSGFPFNGSSWQLSGGYDLKVKSGTIICYLPYFGRAFWTPYNPTEGGIKFTSSDFGWVTKNRKKGGWDITIRPKDVQGMNFLQLSVSPGGYGSLQVVDNNRQSISFNGVIEKLPEKSNVK